MFVNLQEFISNNQDDLIITGGISKEKVHVLEEILGLKFRSEIRDYLYLYGIIMGYGVEMLGCGNSGESSLVKETQRFRKYGLSKEYIVIRNVDEWIYCFNNHNGEVSSWDRIEKSHLIKGDDLEKYILNELMEAKEEW